MEDLEMEGKLQNSTPQPGVSEEFIGVLERDVKINISVLEPWQGQGGGRGRGL